MAVYTELVVEDLEKRFRKNLDGRSRAGVRNVRRPLRGIEIKEDTYAVFRVIQADGTELKLVDSSWPEGEGRGYANFLLQSVQDARMERQQIIETFSSPIVFFFGESPRFLDVSAVLLNTHDFNWEAEWWENYNKYLRGTQLVEAGARAYLFYDDTIIEGYPMNATAAKSASDPNMVQLQFRMFVTNYANVSSIGDPNFPIHDEAIIPQQLNQRDDRTFLFQLEPPEASAQRLLIEYLKRLGATQIQQEIAKAKSIEQVRALQRQYALDQLGVQTEGANLLSLGKSYFQGVLGAVRNDGETVDQANQRFRSEAKKALQLSQQGDPKAAAELLAAGRPLDAASALSARSGVGNNISLTEALRRSIVQSATYPGQDLAGFAERASKVVFPGGARQILEPKRTLPWRSKIIDNYDEYTGVSPREQAEAFEARTGVPVNGEVPDLPAAMSQAMTDNGITPQPENVYRMGVIKWKPGEGVSVDRTQSPFTTSNPLGDPQAPLTGSGYRYTYSRSWGSTSQAGGASGGSLGGGFGPGTAGKAQSPEDLFTAQGGGPYGSPYGGNSSLPPYSVTGGVGPDGKPLFEAKYVYGPTPGGSFFSGSATLDALRAQDESILGDGSFGIHALPGKMP